MKVLPSRRSVVQGAGLTLAAATAPALAAASAEGTARGKIKLGFDNYAVRSMKWKAKELVDHAASLRLDSLLISDLDAFDSLDDKPLKDIRKRAADKGVQIHLGTWSVCPTSGTFKNKWGTAGEHLALGIRAARALGSPVLRVILGNSEDRKSEGGIRARIKDMVAVLKAHRGRAVDAHVKIAVENHAGDLQAHELLTLVEDAGKDFVGVNIDPGNAVWTMEDPVQHLERLGPYVVTSSMRDSMIWESDNGCTVQWTAMGAGVVDFKAYFARFAELCPGVPVHIETISGFNRELPTSKPEFWNLFPDARAADFARFVALAKNGKLMAPWRAPEGQDRDTAERAHQKAELDRSLTYCRSLGLGTRA